MSCRLAFCLLIIFNSPAFARGPGWTLSMPTFQDDGDNRVPFKTTVGTVQPVQLIDPDVLKDRAVMVTNPSADWELMLGTTSDFNVIDVYWTVPINSGTFVSSNHGPLWAMYPPGGASESVRGVAEKQ